tara:strand:+ start:12111 stop:12494 length:384 start_codon:yes stop_codon:yes gene_type:complete
MGKEKTLTVSKIRVIEWMLELSKPKYLRTMHNSCLRAVEEGVLTNAGDEYELTYEWLYRYVFSRSKFAKVPATLREFGGVLDRPTNPKAGKGWKFPNIYQAETAVAYLGSWGIKANRFGTLIVSLDY